MTNEEAIKWLKDIHHRFNPTGEKLENEGGDVHLQALDMAIEALRSEVLCALADRVCPFQGKEFVWCLTCPHISEEDRALVKKAVAEPKTGEWVKVIDEETPNVTKWHYECDQCGAGRWEKGQRYCQNCGARMNGGEEE